MLMLTGWVARVRRVFMPPRIYWQRYYQSWGNTYPMAQVQQVEHGAAMTLSEALAASPTGTAVGDLAFVQRLPNGNLHLSAHGGERYEVEKCFESAEQLEDWLDSDGGYPLYIMPGMPWEPYNEPISHHTCGFVGFRD